MLIALLLALAPPSSPLPSFEVASVKRAGADTDLNPKYEPMFDPRSGRFNCNSTLGEIIEAAYSVHGWEFSAPDWVKSERYAITALAPPRTTKKNSGLMVRRVLDERFKIQVHYEDREQETYVLVRGRGKLKLPAAKTGAVENYDFTLGHFAGIAPMSAFAAAVGGFLGRTVVDQTGYKGLYVFQVSWAKDIPGFVPGEGQTTYLRAAGFLGMKMEMRKASFPFLVVDSIEKEPTAN